MKVKDILDRVTMLYNDTEYIRVPESHYFKFIDDALNQLVLVRPDCHVKTEIVKLEKGTRQTLPSDGCALIEIYMNKKKHEDPETMEVSYSNYYPIAHVERTDLDYFSNWQTQGTSSKDYITEFAYEHKSPRVYWVCPYVGDTDVYVEMDYSYAFPKVSAIAPDADGTWKNAENYDIDIQDIWMGPLCNYILYLLYSTDSTSQNDRQIAQMYLQSFYQSLSMEYQSTDTVIPDVKPRNMVASGGAA